MTPTIGPAALIERAIVAVPTLNYFGCGLYQPGRFDAAATAAAIAAGQVELRAAVSEVALCAEWLDGIGATKRVWRGGSSYGFKHGVMNWLRQQGRPSYVSNGSFIAAAVGLGYPFAVVGPNARFGLCLRDLKAVRRRDVAAVAA
jgi:hypothetical protein